MKENTAIIILFSGLIGATAFVLANSYYFYTTTTPYENLPPRQNGIALAVDVINDTQKSKPSNLTTVVDRQFIDEKTNSLVVEFNYTTGQNGLGIDYFQCAIDFKEYGECSSPFVLRLKDYLDNKTHTLEIRAIDMKGKVEQNPVAILFPINMTTIK